MIKFLDPPGIGLDPSLNCSVPPATTPTVSAAGKYIPVLVSPELANEGAPTLPSPIAVKSANPVAVPLLVVPT